MNLIVYHKMNMYQIIRRNKLNCPVPNSKLIITHFPPIFYINMRKHTCKWNRERQETTRESPEGYKDD